MDDEKDIMLTILLCAVSKNKFSLYKNILLIFYQFLKSDFVQSNQDEQFQVL